MDDVAIDLKVKKKTVNVHITMMMIVSVHAMKMRETDLDVMMIENGHTVTMTEIGLDVVMTVIVLDEMIENAHGMMMTGTELDMMTETDSDMVKLAERVQKVADLETVKIDLENLDGVMLKTNL